MSLKDSLVPQRIAIRVLRRWIVDPEVPVQIYRAPSEVGGWLPGMELEALYGPLSASPELSGSAMASSFRAPRKTGSAFSKQNCATHQQG